MDTKLKYLLGGIVFLVCAGAAFWITKSLKNNVESDNRDNEELVSSDSGLTETPAPSDSAENNVSDTNKAESSAPELSGPILMNTKVQKMGDTYTLEVTCMNVPVNIILGYEIPALRQKNLDGFFTRIPGCKNGSYKVNVLNNETGEVLVSKVVSGFKLVEEKPSKLMTAHEFQALLLNQSDNSLLGGKHPNVARNIRLSFEGLREDDKKPGDILAVREKIAFGIWSSARVIGVNYDENGKIYAAKIQPIY